MHAVKAIICTVGEGAILDDMYPPDKYCDYLFYTNVIKSYGRLHAETDPRSWNVTPTDLDDLSADLDALRKQGMKHYGLLTLVALPNEFNFTILSASSFIKKLKQIQDGDRTAKTVLAIGSYDYVGNFIAKVRDYFTNVANDRGRREILLAIIIYLCLLVLIILVIVLVISATDLLKAIICTVGEGATIEDMYPPDKYCDYLFYTNVITSYDRIHAEKDPGSWHVFRRVVTKYKIMELGISFSLQNVTPNDLDDASNDLDALRREGMRHYGLLTMLASQNEFNFTVWSMKPVIKRLKEIQGGDETAKAVVAIGSYDYAGGFIAKFREYFINVVK
ncbi:hypothetical protein HPB52_016853 [Rhipicephalus sanguineus]|uniref:Uncharacterized protein n=1 Tax=Rhipicephalus sanguineus TaxID=34632 RepID=A0A9D4PEY4_RHISA|nr:hypothetical protein HPB52_016853 [Rhipicephalus sanguineus]